MAQTVTREMGPDRRLEDMTGLFFGGAWQSADAHVDIIDKYTFEPFLSVVQAQPDDVTRAVDSAERASRSPLPAAERESILLRAADILDELDAAVLYTYVAETGFTLADARTELARAGDTLRLCAGEARRLSGEEIPVSATPGSEHRLAFTMRVPVGIVCAIAPFNAPLNTVAHKVGPAIAAGNAVVLKPAQATPVSSMWLTYALHEAGLPPGFMNLVIGPGRSVGDQLLKDGRIRYYTFTGSTEVGLAIKQVSGVAKTHLELGSNSATIVCDDADLVMAADRIVPAAFRKAGQVCTSVQRVLVAESVRGDLEELLRERTEALVVGDPYREDARVGPLISVAEAERAQEWVASSGGRTLTGGDRDRAVLQPALITQVPDDATVMCNEAFAPIVAMQAWSTFDDAIARANTTPYGLQAGIFTQDVDRAFAAAKRLQVGGVMINYTSSYHAELMPYGGVKASGYGLE
ncbi:MAG: aldehyde dehydrogenase family protein, partial [Nitriliruptoraceae bacterium]